MKREVLYDDGRRKWIFFGRDPDCPESVIDTNEYLIMQGEKALLTDPGGMEIFAAVVTAVSGDVKTENLEALFGSHQDPDIISSLSLWLDVCAPGTKVYVPSIWTSFIAHFGSPETFELIPDEGMTIPLGGSSSLQAIPAHYAHASANFSLYDPVAKILFSGDIGAALLPESETRVYVENFDPHVSYMEGFHRRWMPSNRAKNDWVRRVRALDIEMICPQHGMVFRGEDVGRFLDWFEALEVGAAIGA